MIHCNLCMIDVVAVSKNGVSWRLIMIAVNREGKKCSLISTTSC